MSVNQVDKQTGDTSRIAGGTLYADAPIGAILAFGGATAPAGWMICNGAAVSRTTYAALFAAIGTAFGAGDGSTTFNIPDLREATTKGAGETGQTVGAHVKSGGLAVGEFIDDRVEKHTHFKTRAIYASSGVYEAISENGSTDPTNDNQYNTGRSGDTTEVKAVGVNYIIKAQQVALPADFATELDKKQNITDNTLETDSKTVPGAINEINTALTANVVGTEVNLNSYTSVDAPYTCPSDGYVILTVGASVSTAVECKINNAIVLTLKGNNADTVHNATFVRKGMTIHCNGSTVDANRIVSYVPLSNS